jgi:hypothetical protein
MAAGINPFALQMQQLQRRQALADQLMQEGNQPLDTQMVGNVAVRRSPFEGIAKLAQAATGAYVQNKNDQTYQDLAAQMMAGQRSALAGLSGGASPTAAPTDAPNMPPESIRAPGFTPPPAPPTQGNGFANTLDAAQNAANYGVDPEVIKAAIADQSRTDQMKNDAASGIAPTERGNLVRRDSIKQAFVPGSGGMLDIDATSGQPVFRTLPGLAESSAAATGMSTAATQANTPHYEPDPFHPGQFKVTYATPPSLGANTPPLGSVGRGGLPGQAPPPQPGAALPPPGARSALPPPGAPTLTPTAGGTAADLEEQKLGAKTGQDFATDLNAKATDALAGKRTLSEMQNLLQGFEPGKGAPILSGLGSAAVAMGVSPETVTQLTNVNPGDAEAFQKGTAALAGEAAKQVTNRVTQTEFKVFLANNPNWMMTPQGIKRVMDFMGKGFDQQIDQQQQFAKWSKTASPNRWAIDFPAAYNQQQRERISAGQTNSAPASLTGVRTRSDTVKAESAQGGPIQWQAGMTADQARAKYPKGTVFQFPDGSHGSL